MCSTFSIPPTYTLESTYTWLRFKIQLYRISQNSDSWPMASNWNNTGARNPSAAPVHDDSFGDPSLHESDHGHPLWTWKQTRLNLLAVTQQRKGHTRRVPVLVECFRFLCVLQTTTPAKMMVTRKAAGIPMTTASIIAKKSGGEAAGKGNQSNQTV